MIFTVHVQLLSIKMKGYGTDKNFGNESVTLNHLRNIKGY